MFASGLSHQRLIRVAPNGDVFVAESEAGRVRVLRPNRGQPASASVFADGLHGPFGIAFYPPGRDPEWVYVANTNSVVRFAYRSGDLKARGAGRDRRARICRPAAATARATWCSRPTAHDVRLGRLGLQCRRGHGKARCASELQAWQSSASARRRLGQRDRPRRRCWRSIRRARTAASSRPASATASAWRSRQATGELWCSTNERDGLGDNLPPDYVTRVREGAFYGWPWYYIGANEDPRHRRRAAGPEGQDHGPRRAAFRRIRPRCR